MKKIAICILIIALILGICTVALAKTSPNFYYQVGAFLKEALKKQDNQPESNPILAKYDGSPISAELVRYYKNISSLRSEEDPTKHDTDFEVINGIIESMILLEEAERLGLSATDEEIASMVNNAIKAYSIPSGKEMMDAYFQGAGITFDEYISMLKDQAPYIISTQKLIDSFGKQYCEENNLEFTKINPPAEMVAAQKAYIKQLFEQNKDKIEYFIDVPA